MIAAAKKETAEQKLLKMIESSAEGKESVKTQQKVVHKQNTLQLVRLINKVLLVGIVLAAGFFVNEINNGMAFLNQPVSFMSTSTSVTHPLNVTNQIPVNQSLSTYLALMQTRNLFQPYTKPEGSNVVEAAPSDRKIVQKTAGLKLVGVSWSNSVSSASVMLEDTQNNVTHFLQKGEKIGDIEVKTIYADSVKLGYENEEITIRYDNTKK